MGKKHKLCPKCRHPNTVGLAKCSLCGQPMDLDAAPSLPAVTVPPKEEAKPPRKGPKSTNRPPGEGAHAPGPKRARVGDELVPDDARESVPVLGSPPYAYAALVRVVEGGNADECFRLRDKPLTIGRESADLTFANDPLLSGKHASVRTDGRVAHVCDLKSRNGTFVRCKEPTPLSGEAEFLIGTTLVRFLGSAQEKVLRTVEFADAGGESGLRAIVVRGKGRTGAEVSLDMGATIGRQGQTLNLDDRFVSPVHARIVSSNGKACLVDAGSVNGIYVRVPADREARLEPGDLLRLGRQVFRFELRQS